MTKNDQKLRSNFDLKFDLNFWSKFKVIFNDQKVTIGLGNGLDQLAKMLTAFLLQLFNGLRDNGSGIMPLTSLTGAGSRPFKGRCACLVARSGGFSLRENSHSVLVHG